MNKHKFVLAKHTRKNGEVFYTCKTVVQYKRLTYTMLGDLFNIKTTVTTTYFVTKDGGLFNTDFQFKKREDALLGIDNYMKLVEEREGKEIASTETEIIYR